MLKGQQFCILDSREEHLIEILDITNTMVTYKYIHVQSSQLLNRMYKRSIESFNKKLTNKTPEEYKLEHL